MLEALSERYQYTQLHLGVQVRIVLYAEKEEIANKAARDAFQRIAALEDVFSHYRAHSELSQLAQSAYQSPIRVSNELFVVFDAALHLSRQTGGAFDITIGPFMAAWRDSRKTLQLPSESTLQALRSRSGWERIELDPENRQIRLLKPEMQLDMGGIAKGYILDEAGLVLKERGVSRFLIEAGGDIVVGEAPPASEGWVINIPGAPADSEIALRAGALTNAAIATSGDTEQYVDIDGTRYAHVIDPRTGLGSTQRVMATVIANDGLTADSYATTLAVLGHAGRDILIVDTEHVLAFIRDAGL